ncbi:ROK family transcriptional regulator [Mycetocola zhadangensis]|uniref:ROK family transcriptional regulator n=1 Tax=Mycetocola zhadangensis TaxID=1164595 RepID=A0A3L7IX95_9MICO|nr:ROK family transcriptional regulator [Mycetocola zhadangensis]RLQ82783.1 ROK family transcriptional regulator [Mycetocola zhadangensis]GGE98166.1 sugar kinase [Mycetocola zhadangensis]
MNNRGTNLDTVRQYNLSRILGLVHREGAVSRSTLTRETGLNRSTVAALVTELAALRLVVEAEPDVNRGVGRPSPVVRPHPDCVAFAVNPEQDAINIGVVRMSGEVVDRVRHEIDEPLGVAETVRVTAELIAALRAKLPAEAVIAGVGVAVPGLVRSGDGLVRLAPHLGWLDEPVASLLTDATGYAARAANDASLGALAEHTFGAGRGVDNLVYLNGGASGIGGGVIVNGIPLGGVAGYAGEFGHNLVTAPDGPGKPSTGGALEDEVNRGRLLELLELRSADAPQFEQALLTSTSAELRAEAVRQLGILSIALRNAINVLNPELVVLGGFLASLHALDPELLESLVAEQTLAAAFESVRIVRAQLGPDLLLIGAAQLAFEPLIDNPARSGS